VAIHFRSAGYNPDDPPTSWTGPRVTAESPPKPTGTSLPLQRAEDARAVPRSPRPGDAARIDECLQLLARTIQQFHTYPPTSPLCHNAVEACHRALAAIDQRDHLDFRVSPHELIVDEVPTGRGTIIEHELARRLHAASIAQVTIQRASSLRELARFCIDLVSCGARGTVSASLIELLTEHGVHRIALRPAYRPEVLEVGAPSAPVVSLIEHQQQRREEVFAAGGVVNHLYPPDKGWVRLDPASQLSSVSLVDLALLTEDPAALATMLLSLTDDAASERQAPGDALAQKFGDVATLFAALDPNVARVMFGRLARAVLDLDPGRRQALLRRTILPGLLDGKIDGVVLKDFPDLDLADSLCLLLDLETAAPEVVTTALARLDLPADRQEAMLPLIKERLEERGRRSSRETGLDVHVRKLLHIDHCRAKSFAEFSAFDLALDDQAVTALAQIKAGIAASDLPGEQLSCLLKLVRLQTSPENAQRFAQRAALHLHQIQQEDRWHVFAQRLSQCAELADALREPKPDVADTVTGMLSQFCGTEHVARLIDLAAAGPEERAVVDAIIRTLGSKMGPALLAAARNRQGDGKDAKTRAAIQLLTDHAVVVAPAIVATLQGTDAVTARVVVRILGLAGTGFEQPVAGQLTSGDEQTVREALRSLARMGTPQAAALVRCAIERANGWLASAGAETLWHFPANEAHRQVRELLGKREFVIRQPIVAARLLDRATQSGATGLQPILVTLAPLRYRLWRPALVRVGRRARTLLER
jgi:hypothetical protein